MGRSYCWACPVTNDLCKQPCRRLSIRSFTNVTPQLSWSDGIMKNTPFRRNGNLSFFIFCRVFILQGIDLFFRQRLGRCRCWGWRGYFLCFVSFCLLFCLFLHGITCDAIQYIKDTRVPDVASGNVWLLNFGGKKIRYPGIYPWELMNDLRKIRHVNSFLKFIAIWKC